MSIKLKLSEKEIQSVISDWLTLNRIVHWRLNSGAIYLENKFTLRKKGRLVRFAFFLYPKGEALTFPDIAGIFQGIYFSIECKKPGAKPSPNQIKSIDLINSHGGLAFWTDSLSLVIEKFQIFFQQSFLW